MIQSWDELTTQGQWGKEQTFGDKTTKTHTTRKTTVNIDSISYVGA